MAEIGLIASIIGIASVGIKLSITLYAFSETVSTAHDDIKNIARDVSLTSSVLDELAANLKNDEQARLYSGTALATAQTVVKDCEGVFGEIEAALRKAMERMSKGEVGSGEKRKKGGKVVLSAMEKLKWPFLQPKMELLRGNLERLKSTLVLMLNVLTYARKVQTEYKKEAPKDDYQRVLIENLVQANREATRNFQTLLRTIGSGENEKSMEMPPMQQDINPTIQTASSSQNQPRSLDEPSMSPLSPEQGPPPAYITTMASTMSALPQITLNSPKSAAAEIVLAAESTAACLKRIGKALNQFDRSGPASMHPTRVSIELLQDLESAPGKVPPWTVLSIIEQKRAPAPIREESYDPYIHPSGRTAVLQAQIDDTVGAMRENINKVAQRGERLDSLQGMTGNLDSSNQAFRKGANRVRAQQSWLGTLGRAWDYVPSPSAVVSSVQAAIDAGLSTSQSDEDDMVADAPYIPAHTSTDPDPSAFTPKPITHSPTFDDILGPEPRHSRRRERSSSPQMPAQVDADRILVPLQQPPPMQPVSLRQSRTMHAVRPPIPARPELGDVFEFAIAAAAGIVDAGETDETDEPFDPSIHMQSPGSRQRVSEAVKIEVTGVAAPDVKRETAEKAEEEAEEADEEADAEEADAEEAEDADEEVDSQVAEADPEDSEVYHLLKEWTTLYE